MRHRKLSLTAPQQIKRQTNWSNLKTLTLLLLLSLLVFIQNQSIAQKKPGTAINLNGFYAGSNGGHYFLRQIGTDVYWFGENPNGAWANVFKGKLNGNKLKGSFYDVPKGRFAGKGDLTLSITKGGRLLTKIAGNGRRRTFTKTNLPSKLSKEKIPGFHQNNNINNLTGGWKGNDNGTYYIRDIDGMIIWFGEKAFSSGRPAFANVAIGKRTGNIINLDWVDVPKGRFQSGKGKLRLKINHANEIVKISGNGFGGSKWSRGDGHKPAKKLYGFVDMHTHPMSHLGFGRKIMHGSPEGSLATALGNCNCTHGGWGVNNTCGDYIRADVVNQLDETYIYKSKNAIHWDHPHDGYPNFTHWPHYSSATHQQMHWTWIKRAYQGGLRIMVALAVHNSLLTEVVNGMEPRDDKGSIEHQLKEMQTFVRNHSDFMEIAKSAEEVRRIVSNNKLAVILGVETEDFGNLSRRKHFNKEDITEAEVIKEIQELYDKHGVRYIFPIHIANNLFGGAALYKDMFLLATKYYTNSFPQVEESTNEIGYQARVSPFNFPAADLLRSRNLGWIIDHQPNYPTPAQGTGHRNRLGLTNLGRAAIQKMMRLGMMIDIDHMSEKSVASSIALAKANHNYPLNSGHSGLRVYESGKKPSNENQKTREQYIAIRDLGGMAGVGHGANASGFVHGFRQVLDIMGNKNVAIGTDVNGLFPLPGPDPDPNIKVIYDDSFPNYTTANKKWDINTDGMAHYGLFPDFIKGWESAGLSTEEKGIFFSSAEYFTQMWEKCEQISKGLPNN